MLRLKLVLVMLCFAGIICKGENTDTIIFKFPEIPPSFKYDTCSSLHNSLEQYFRDNFKIPNVLLDMGFTGSYVFQFIVEKNGSISNVKQVRGIYDTLDKFVLEFVKSMPLWIPGSNNGNIVRSFFVIPVHIEWLYGNTE